MYLFVYGTLKKGHGNHRVLGDAPFVKMGWLNDYAMYHLGGFPGIVPLKDHVVEGEVYKVQDFNRLDSLEGYNSDTDSGMYLRRQVRLDDDSLAWVYIWNRDLKGCKLIEDGVWR